MKIAIFYHCLALMGDPPQPISAASTIIKGQMQALTDSGLLTTADYFLVGVNGGPESKPIISANVPQKAHCVYHGLQCKNENRTIIELEKWLPMHDEWYVFYFHSKGITHPPGDGFTTKWRNCMTGHCVTNWKQCVQALDEGYDCAGVHWMEPPETPEGQYIFAGTFWWAKASYLLTLPSLLERDRIKISGLDAQISRYEAEVWIGNGPRKPRVKDFHPNWNPSKIDTCT